MSIREEKHQPRYVGQDLMEFLVRTRYEDLPPEVIERAKLIVLDAVSCMLAGRHTRELFGLSLRELCPAGDVRPAGCDFQTTAPYAAAVNVLNAQTHDFNDGFNDVGMRGAVYHPGRIAVSVALALGRQLHVSGKELITAVVMGTEAGARLRNCKQHSTISDGQLAAAAAARLLGADAEQMRSAISLASFWGVARCGASTPYMAPVYNNGKNWPSVANQMQYFVLVRNAVEAAQFAMMGYQGPPMDINAAQSTMYSTTGLGKSYYCMDLYFKPWPCCRKTHGAIGAALELRESGVRPEDIERIRIFQQATGMYVNTRFQADTDINFGGQFSLLYTVSCAFLDGDVTLEHFRWPDRKAPARYLEFSQKIRVISDNGLDGYNTVSPNHGRVEVDLKDGRTLSAYCQYPLGSEPNAMSPEQHLRKFDCCAEDLPADRRAAAREGILRLEQYPRI